MRTENWSDPTVSGFVGFDDGTGVLTAWPHNCHHCGEVFSINRADCPLCNHATLTWANPERCAYCNQPDLSFLLAKSIEKEKARRGSST